MPMDLGFVAEQLPYDPSVFENEKMWEFATNIHSWTEKNRQLDEDLNNLRFFRNSINNPVMYKTFESVAQMKQFTSQSARIRNIEASNPSNQTGYAFGGGTGGLSVGENAYAVRTVLREGYIESGVQYMVGQQVKTALGNSDLRTATRIKKFLNLYIMLFNLYKRMDSDLFSIPFGLRRNFQTSPLPVSRLSPNAAGDFEIPAAKWLVTQTNLAPTWMADAKVDRTTAKFFKMNEEYDIICDYGTVDVMLTQNNSFGMGNISNLISNNTLIGSNLRGANIYPTNEASGDGAFFLMTIPKRLFHCASVNYEAYALTLERNKDGFYDSGVGKFFFPFEIGGGESPFMENTIFDRFKNFPKIKVLMTVQKDVIDNSATYVNEPIAKIDTTSAINVITEYNTIFDSAITNANSPVWGYKGTFV